MKAIEAAAGEQTVQEPASAFDKESAVAPFLKVFKCLFQPSGLAKGLEGDTCWGCMVVCGTKDCPLLGAGLEKAGMQRQLPRTGEYKGVRVGWQLSGHAGRNHLFIADEWREPFRTHGTCADEQGIRPGATGKQPRAISP